VIVNGQLVKDNGEPTGARPGRALKSESRISKPDTNSNDE